MPACGPSRRLASNPFPLRRPAMFKDLLVATTGLGDDAAAVDAALQLAAADGGHVAVLVQVGAPPLAMSPLGLPAVEAYVAGCEEAHREGERLCAQWREHVARAHGEDRKSTRLNSSHPSISYAVFCL